LSEVLRSLRRPGSRWPVFGAVANRDPGKRGTGWAAIAAELADLVIVPHSKPPGEDPAAIAARSAGAQAGAAVWWSRMRADAPALDHAVAWALPAMGVLSPAKA